MYTLIISIFIYIGLFLFGIALMRIGFNGLMYHKLKNIQPDISPFNGFLIGVILTMLLQSSSASIALLVTFLATIKLSLPFAVSYLIGANIGTTFTAQLFVWNDTHLMFLCLIIGVIGIFWPNKKAMLFGSILFGLGVVFSSLNGMESLVHSIPVEKIEHAVNSPTNNPYTLTLFGTILTVIIQSSTAAIGMMMSFSHDGMIPLIQTYYVILGANIGTCFTVILVSIGQPYHAKITAYAHVWINVLGAIIAFPLVVSNSITNIATYLSINPEQQIVIISVLYNVFTGIIFLLLLKPFCKYLTLIHRKQV